MKFELTTNNTHLKLIQANKDECAQLKLSLSKYVKNYFFQAKYKMTKWDGKIDFFKTDRVNFGLWYEVYRVCKEYDYPFEIVNKQQFPIDKSIIREDVEKFIREFLKDHKDEKDPNKSFMAHEHQIDAVYKILKHRYGLIEVATAGGKSLIFSLVVFYYLKHINPDAKILLVVPAIGLVTQFYNEIHSYNLGYYNENKNPLDLRIDEIMSEKPRKHIGGEPNIYVGLFNSLVNWPAEFFKQFDIVAVDEGHLLKAKSLIDIMDRCSETSKIRFGMSGSYPPEGSAELFTIESVTGPKLINIKAKDLMDKGIIANVKIKALILNHNDRSFAENVHAIKKSGNGKKAWELERNYAQTSAPRKIFLGKLISKFKQNSIVLFQNIIYGTELYNYFRDNIPGKDFYYIDGSTSKDKREAIRKELEKTDGNVKILVGSFGTMSTGINVKAIVNLVLCDSFRSDRVIRQSIGRALRIHKEKEKAIIFDIVDQFHPEYKGTLYNHFQSRKNEIYIPQQYQFEELKANI
jgi:superfamily II DNA or RNA helicase